MLCAVCNTVRFMLLCKIKFSADRTARGSLKNDTEKCARIS